MIGDPLTVLMASVEAELTVIVDNCASELDVEVVDPVVAAAPVEATPPVDGTVLEVVNDASPVEDANLESLKDPEEVEPMASVPFAELLVPVEAAIVDEVVVSPAEELTTEVDN